MKAWCISRKFVVIRIFRCWSFNLTKLILQGSYSLNNIKFCYETIGKSKYKKATLKSDVFEMCQSCIKDAMCIS